MSDHMVVVDGVRYRVEDAKRLGLVADELDAKAKTPKNKARKTVSNKAVDVSGDK